MTKKAVTLEIPELIQFLVQELHDLPDDRKTSVCRRIFDQNPKKLDPKYIS